jgi:hypothetical protein
MRPWVRFVFLAWGALGSFRNLGTVESAIDLSDASSGPFSMRQEQWGEVRHAYAVGKIGERDCDGL